MDSKAIELCEKSFEKLMK